MKNDELLHKWVKGTLTASELALFKQRPEYDSLVHLHAETESLKVPAWDKAAVLEAVLSQKKEAKIRKLSTNNWWKYASAAAVTLMVAAFIFWPSQGSIQKMAEVGEILNGSLPDQSTYVLNAESKLSYDTKNWSDNRILQLEGEAYFEVEKGKTFLVQTTNGAVQVLGTHFNVRSRAGMLEVSCQEGKVGVQSIDGTQLVQLEANDAARIESGKLVDQWKGNGENEVSWIQGVIQFRNTKLKEVIEEIERQFKVQILPGNIDTKVLITCNFQKNNLENALQTTLTPLGLSFKIKENQQVEIFN